MIQTGLDWLSGQLASYASVSCTLTPVQSTPKTVRATLGKVKVEVPDANGATLIVEVATAIVPVADLAGYVPRNGDRLTGTGIDYEVAAPAHGAASWAWVDTYRIRMRLYLRERNAERTTG